MKLLSITQVAEKWCFSARHIRLLCNEDRMEGEMEVKLGYSSKCRENG